MPPDSKRPSRISVNGTETDAFLYVPLTYYASTVCLNRWSWTTSADYHQDEISINPDKLQTIMVQMSEELYYAVNTSMLSPKTSQSVWISNEPAWSDECSVPTYEIAPGPSSTETYPPNKSGLCKSIEFHFTGVKGAHGSLCEDESQGFPGRTIAAIVLSIIAFLLIVGLLESWLTFRSLCLGKAARRGPPITFAFIFPFLACFVLLLSSAGYVAKEQNEQEMLRARWETLRASVRLQQWLLWGFRWAYPPFLGREPPRKRDRRPTDPADFAPEVVTWSRLNSPSPSSDAATCVHELPPAHTPKRQSFGMLSELGRESVELPAQPPKMDVLVWMSPRKN